jgi:hypothetical protein
MAGAMVAASVAAAAAKPVLTPLSGTLTAATFLVTSNGFSVTNSAGTMSVTSVGPGLSVTEWFTAAAATSTLTISGFGSDPGQTFFTTATYNGTAKTSASAIYGFTAGKASWSWTSTLFPFSASVGISRACSIT